MQVIDSGSHIPEQRIPINLHAQKVLEWLVDRRHVPRDWKEKLDHAKRTKLATVITQLRQNHPAVLVSTDLHHAEFENTDNWQFRHCQSLMQSLVSHGVVQTSKSLFGQYQDSLLRQLDETISAYKNSNVYLGEYALFIVHSVKYNIPNQRRQLERLEKQILELDRRAADAVRIAHAVARQLEQQCDLLGIHGNDFASELALRLESELPIRCAGLVELCRHDSVRRAMEIYRSCFDMTSTKREVSNTSFNTLDELIRVGDVSSYNVTRLIIPEALQNGSVEVTAPSSLSRDGIDWGGITMGHLSAPAAVAPAAFDDSALDSTTNPSLFEVEMIESGYGEPIMGSCLLEQPVRDRLLCDLYELDAFLSQRTSDADADTNDATLVAAWQHANRAAILLSQAEYMALRAHLRTVIGAITDPEFTKLLEVYQSGTFAQRLLASLRGTQLSAKRAQLAAEKISAAKSAAVDDARRAKVELDALKKKTLEVADILSSAISSMYNGRPVHWIGQIAEAERPC